MYKNKEIFLRKKTIHTIRDLLGTLYDLGADYVPFYDNCSSDNYSVLKSMLIYERILYTQLPLCEKEMYVPYSFQDMIEAQSYLEILDCVESVKYASYTVNARQLLHKYLYSFYNISSFNLYEQIREKKKGFSINTKIIDDIRILKPAVEIGEYNNIDIMNPFSPSKSIRNLFSGFLKEIINISASLYSHCALYPAITKTNRNKDSCQGLDLERENGQRLYLSIYDIPVFLLLFCYYDHRNFEHILSQLNSGRLPKEKLQDTAIYRLIIQQAKEYKLFDSFSSVSYFLKSCQWRCDNIFLFYKLATLFKYYNLYTSDTILNYVVHSYHLSYTQIITLKKNIIEEIFFDKKFILKGLTSKYLDFMLPFNIFFQCNIRWKEPLNKYNIVNAFPFNVTKEALEQTTGIHIEWK